MNADQNGRSARQQEIVAAAGRPEDVKVDEKAGTITYTEKKTGVWETGDYAEIGRVSRGSREFVFSTRAQKKDGKRVGVKFLLTTSDSISKVKEFYTESVRALGFKVETSVGHGAEFIEATGEGRSLSISIDRTDPEKTAFI